MKTYDVSPGDLFKSVDMFTIIGETFADDKFLYAGESIFVIKTWTEKDLVFESGVAEILTRHGIHQVGCNVLVYYAQKI